MLILAELCNFLWSSGAWKMIPPSKASEIKSKLLCDFPFHLSSFLPKGDNRNMNFSSPRQAIEIRTPFPKASHKAWKYYSNLLSALQPAIKKLSGFPCVTVDDKTLSIGERVPVHPQEERMLQTDAGRIWPDRPAGFSPSVCFYQFILFLPSRLFTWLSLLHWTQIWK